jgi:hypothetical protein
MLMAKANPVKTATGEEKLKAEVKELKAAVKAQGKALSSLEKRLGKLESKGGKGPGRPRKPSAAKSAGEETAV